MSLCCNDPKTNADLARLERMIKDHEKEVFAELLKQDAKLAEFSVKFGGNIQKAIYDYLLFMEQDGKLTEIITDTLLNGVLMLEHKTASIINVKEFGAAGNGVCDDTAAIQNAIDYANQHGRAVYIPAGVYLISKSILLNGCSMIGEVGNIFNTKGTVIQCLTDNFTAIRQGSTSAGDIMFNISDITVSGAAVGFEIVYVINSKYERLYAVDCGTGYKIGDPAAVGCMFCEFNNLYTRNCVIGIDAHSKTYMNNNRFNNGYIFGSDYSMKMAVDGGYGAVGNVFNNVEFRSNNGRGAVLTSCVNTVFNSCYFECGGNVLRMTDYCTVTLNNGTYAIFNPANTFNDKNVIYAEGGGQITINGGMVFVDANYENTLFFGAANDDIFGNVVIIKEIGKTGTASGFGFFNKATRNHEQTVNTGTIVIPADGSAEISFTYDKPFNAVPQCVSVTMRGASGAERGVAYVLSERTATGGKISASNTTTGARSVSFSIYAKNV